MPYIKPNQRTQFDEAIDSLAVRIGPEGELNYVITKLVHTWLIEYGVNYARLNAAIGVLDCAKMELYRQVVAEYEDEKKSENGHVSELDDPGRNF